MQKIYYILAIFFTGFLLTGAGCTTSRQALPPINQEKNTVTEQIPTEKKYTNKGMGFSIDLPNDFLVGEPAIIPPAFGDFPAVKFIFPEKYFTNTNLSVDSGIFFYNNCLLDGVGAAEIKPIKLADKNWQEFTINDAGAGNFFRTTFLQTINGSDCYNLMLFLHSTNIGNYDPGTKKEFDQKGLEEIYYTIAKSFQIISSDVK